MKKMLLVLFVVLESSLFSQTLYYEKTLEFSDSLNRYTAVQLSGNSIILAAYQRYYLRIIKISLGGEVLWHKVFTTDNINQDASNHLCATRDGGFVVTGSKLSSQREQIVIQKFDSSGTIEWEQVFGDTMLREIGLEIVQTVDNGFLLTAGIKDFGYTSPILIKVDAFGKQIWRKDFPKDVSTSSLGYRLRKVDDTSFTFSKYQALIFFSEAGEIKDSLLLNKEIISFAVNEKKEVAVAFDSSIVLYSPAKNKLWESEYSIVPIFRRNLSAPFLLFGFDGNIILAKTHKNTLCKYSFEGSLVWEHSQLFNPKFVLATFDSSYFITGGYPGKNFTIKKVTKNGVIKKVYSQGYARYIFINSISDFYWSGDDVNEVDIYLSADSTKTWTLLGSKITARHFTWTTPTIPSEHCFLKVIDSYDSKNSDVSSMFSIKSGYEYNLKFIHSNNLLYRFYNDGSTGNGYESDGGGALYWPKSSGIEAVFADGFLWGGKVNGEIRTNRCVYASSLTPGTINNDGTRSDPANPKFKVWKIRRDYEQLPDSLNVQYAYEYDNWPGDLGAPFIDENKDGIFSAGIDRPHFLGDETGFFVANDLDTIRSKLIAESAPIGLEMQTTLYTYFRNDYLGDVVFKNIRLMNKSNNMVDSMYVGYMADVSLGWPGDNFLGCDSSMNLGYVFNEDNDDYYYGVAPPAIGYQFLRGVRIKGDDNDSINVNGIWEKGFKDLKLSSFTPLYRNIWNLPSFAIDGSNGANEIHNILSGKLNNGMTFMNPDTDQPFGHYPFSGDPESKTGIYQGGMTASPFLNQGTYTNVLISSGPFTFAPGDTQNIAVAIFLARGSSNVNSVTKLKETAKLIQNFYNKYLTDVEEEKPSTLPSEYALYQNYPNPFNPETKISWQLAVGSFVTLKVYDILGNEVAVLVNEEKPAGKYQINFRGSNLASGVYFYQLRAGQFVQTKKFVVLK